MPDQEIVEVDEQQSNLFKTDDPVQVVEQAKKVAEALNAVIVKQKLFTPIQGKKYVRVEGWQTLGSMLGITAVVVKTEPVEGARGYKAKAEARKVSDGTVVGSGEALCMRDEDNWKDRDDYAILSMAQTRAVAKSLRGPLGFVVSLAGYAATPAEEMTVEKKRNMPPMNMDKDKSGKWRDDPATPAQLKKIGAMGGDPHGIKTKGQASDLIEEMS